MSRDRPYTFKKRYTCKQCDHVDYLWGGDSHPETMCEYCGSLAFGLYRSESCSDEEFFSKVCESCEGDRFTEEGDYCPTCYGGGMKKGVNKDEDWKKNKRDYEQSKR